MATGNEAKKELQTAYKSELQKYVLWGKYTGTCFFAVVLMAFSGSVYSAINSAPKLYLFVLDVWCYLLAVVLGVLWYRNIRAFVSNKANYINALGSIEEVESSSLLRSVWVSKATLWVAAGLFVTSFSLSAVLAYDYYRDNYAGRTMVRGRLAFTVRAGQDLEPGISASPLTRAGRTWLSNFIDGISRRVNSKDQVVLVAYSEPMAASYLPFTLIVELPWHEGVDTVQSEELTMGFLVREDSAGDSFRPLEVSTGRSVTIDTLNSPDRTKRSRLTTFDSRHSSPQVV